MTTPSSRAPFIPCKTPLLIVVSGPSGAGKDVVLARIKRIYPARYIVTMTTRPKRPQEKDGVDYHFVSIDQFEEIKNKNGLLEWANVYGNWYGVPRQPVKEALDSGRDAILKIDIQGAATIKRLLPEAVLIFLMPQSVDELIARLKQRHTESPLEMEKRLKTAEEEMGRLSLFDYVVLNKQGGIEEAVSKIKAIITAEKCRANPRKVVL